MTGQKNIPKKTILCVDDEPGVLSALHRLLRPLRYRVITAEDGQEALVKAYKERPDLIFLDVHMPKMDGHTVLKHLQRQGIREIPVVMLTGDSDPKDIATGYSEGCVYYITKPFRNEYVRNIVQYLIGDLTEREKEQLELKL